MIHEQLQKKSSKLTITPKLSLKVWLKIGESHPTTIYLCPFKIGCFIKQWARTRACNIKNNNANSTPTFGSRENCRKERENRPHILDWRERKLIGKKQLKSTWMHRETWNHWRCGWERRLAADVVAGETKIWFEWYCDFMYEKEFDSFTIL